MLIVGVCIFFFFDYLGAREIYTFLFVGGVRCICETGVCGVCVVCVCVVCVCGVCVWCGVCVCGVLYTSLSPRDRQKTRMPSSA